VHASKRTPDNTLSKHPVKRRRQTADGKTAADAPQQGDDDDDHTSADEDADGDGEAGQDEADEAEAADLESSLKELRAAISQQDLVAESSLCNHIGVHYMGLGSFEAALPFLARDLELSQQTRDKGDQMTAHRQLGVCLQTL